MNALALLLMTACPAGADPGLPPGYVIEAPAPAAPGSSYPSGTYSPQPWGCPSGGCCSGCSTGCCPSSCGCGTCCPAPCGCAPQGCCTSCGEVVSCCPAPCCPSRPGFFTRIRNKVRHWCGRDSCDCSCSCCPSCCCETCESCCAPGAGPTSFPDGTVVYPGGDMAPSVSPSPAPSFYEATPQQMPRGEPSLEQIPTPPMRVR